MPNEHKGVSLTPILDGIEQVYEQMNAFDPGDDAQLHSELVRLRNLLEAVEQLVRAFCRPETPEGQMQAPFSPPRQRPRP